MDDLAEELTVALKALGKAKTVEDKVAYSQVVHNLTQSLGVFLNLANGMMDYGDEGDFEN
ncbi:MAG: hypothetical protein OEV91_05765 [Desulfobulbaceae bacterium]|nr:hypothetical protein [Desulfobulbaceae bacterium]